MAAVAMIAAGLAACGRVAADGGQPGAARPSPAGTGAPPAGTATARTAGTVASPPGAGAASAGTGSAGPAITVSGPVMVTATGPPVNVTATGLTGPVTLTAADSGTVVYLRVGQTVTVVLTASFEAWHVPAAAGTALRRISASGGYPGKQPARAVFLAVAPGTAVLTDESDTACLHAHPPCEVPQRLWQVTVRVTGG